MAIPSLPTLELYEDDLYVVFLGSDELGQVRSLNVSVQSDANTFGRITPGTQRVIGNTTADMTMSIYSDDDLNEFLDVLGFSTRSGTDTPELDPTKTVSFTIKGYDANSTSGAEQHNIALSNFSPRRVRFSLSDGQPGIFEVSGSVDIPVFDPNPAA